MTLPLDDGSGSIADRLRAELRRRIVSGDLRPGALVVEKELAEEFSVSKTPVREALQLLAVDGWVTVLPRRGYTVSAMSFHDIHEVMELRRAIEPAVAAAAAAAATADLVNDLEALLAEQLAAPTHAAAVDAASRFHARIVRAARNGRAERILDHLVAETVRVHNLHSPLAAYVSAADGEQAAHSDLLAAIREADPGKAEEVMREHLREAERAMISASYS